MALPIVAVVGRPNVGKSTFVNRIAQVDDAIVHEMRGVTRDRSYHEADWNGVFFKLIDTGGIEMGNEYAFQGSIRNQAFEATNEADMIVFVVDGKTGINADDEEVARILRRSSKPVLLAVNKMDHPNRLDEMWEFYQLGLGDPWPISAVHGNGTGDLLDELVHTLHELGLDEEEQEEDLRRAETVDKLEQLRRMALEDDDEDSWENEGEEYEEYEDDPDELARNIIRWAPPITLVLCAIIAMGGYVWYQIFLK